MATFGKIGTRPLITRWFTAKDYIQNGLVAMWDGIENAGWGIHDRNAAVWKDLVRGVDATYSVSSEIPRWGESFWQSVSNSDAKYFITTTPSLVSTNGCTIEVLFEKATNARGTMFGGYQVSGGNNCSLEYHSNYRGLRWFHTGGPDVHAASPSVTIGVPQYFSCIRTGDDFSLRAVSYSVIASATSTNRKWTAGNMLIGTDGRITSMNWNGKVYSIRFYNRALNASEISYNHSIDKIRFNLK